MNIHSHADFHLPIPEHAQLYEPAALPGHHHQRLEDSAASAFSPAARAAPGAG